jgi:hypothetical protein
MHLHLIASFIAFGALSILNPAKADSDRPSTAPQRERPNLFESCGANGPEDTGVLYPVTPVTSIGGCPVDLQWNRGPELSVTIFRLTSARLVDGSTVCSYLGGTTLNPQGLTCTLSAQAPR